MAIHAEWALAAGSSALDDNKQSFSAGEKTLSVASRFLYFLFGGRYLRKVKQGVLLALIFCGPISFSSSANAEEYYWWLAQYFPTVEVNKFSSPQAVCQKLAEVNTQLDSNYYSVVQSVTFNPTVSYIEYICRHGTYRKSDGMWMGWPGYSVQRGGDSCAAGSSLNPVSHLCENSSISNPSKQKGNPDSGQVCNASAVSKLVSDPINFAIGNTYLEEADFKSFGPSPIRFSRYYNSVDGLWNHTYSTHLAIDGSTVSLIRADGSRADFWVTGNTAVALGEELGSLIRLGGNWVYTASSQIKQVFNSGGKLISVSEPGGNAQTLTYGPESNVTQVTVTDNFGNTLSFSQDINFRPAEMHTAGLDVTYSYNSSGQFYRVDRVRNGQTENRTYHYEVAGKPSLLTGITDERGVRAVTWAYDDQDRAISSEMAGAIGKIHIDYHADGSSTVTNELGKQTLYHYQVIQGVKYITSVEGEPTVNCPASNSTYTYNDRGQVLTKTDAKGFITTHLYNNRGLETSRTEATGTPQARTTTTTWHATFNLPLTVTEGGQVTTYTYDAQGRQITRSKTSL